MKSLNRRINQGMHQTMNYEEVLTPVLFVIKLGPDAYKDKTRFPSGPSCKVGDFVIVRPNTGTTDKNTWQRISFD